MPGNHLQRFARRVEKETKKMEKKQRTIALEVCGLRVRETMEGEEKSREIEGHAVVFGQRSVNLAPWSTTREIYEVMEPGSITEELIKRSDVVLTCFHDNSRILGRSVNGRGTLKMSLDEMGVLVRCTLPRTATGDEMLELIERGDISGMSFAYTADEADNENGVSYERTEEKGAEGREVWLRHVKRVNGLYDVTIAGHPAYQGTDIGKREAEDLEAHCRETEPEEKPEEEPKEPEEKPEGEEPEDDAERECKEKAERIAAQVEALRRSAKF